MRLRIASGPQFALLFWSLLLGACHRGHVAPDQWASARVQSNQSAIVGRIISRREAMPLASARVRLLTVSGQLVDSVRTDHDGAFVVGPTVPGVYRLDFRMIAHRPMSMTRELRAGSIDTLNIRLTDDDSGVLSDCIGPEKSDGTRSFGLQYCRP